MLSGRNLNNSAAANGGAGLAANNTWQAGFTQTFVTTTDTVQVIIKPGDSTDKANHQFDISAFNLVNAAPHANTTDYIITVGQNISADGSVILAGVSGFGDNWEHRYWNGAAFQDERYVQFADDNNHKIRPFAITSPCADNTGGATIGFVGSVSFSSQDSTIGGVLVAQLGGNPTILPSDLHLNFKESTLAGTPPIIRFWDTESNAGKGTIRYDEAIWSVATIITDVLLYASNSLKVNGSAAFQNGDVSFVNATTVTFATGSTGSGTALLGATNCPAVTPSAVYKWVPLKLADGSTVYMPVWK